MACLSNRRAKYLFWRNANPNTTTHISGGTEPNPFPGNHLTLPGNPPTLSTFLYQLLSDLSLLLPTPGHIHIHGKSTAAAFVDVTENLPYQRTHISEYPGKSGARGPPNKD